MEDLSKLVCGEASDHCVAANALSQLSSSIQRFSTRAITYLSDTEGQDVLSFGPFCARVLLENACAALVGRIDSFRIVYLSEFQSQPEYEPGKRAKSAFSWFGDVIPEDKPTQQIWSAEHTLPKISRALFSQHMDYLYWKPAVERMLDFINAQNGTLALTELHELDAETYINVTRGKSNQLYSTLSKGVHWEFFTSALIFDRSTITSAIRDTCILVSQLGLASHFIPTAYASLAPDAALAKYIQIRNAIR